MKYKYVQVNNKNKYSIKKSLLKDLINNYNEKDLYYNKYGKPYIKDVFFNISHSFGYMIVATSDSEIGVDIEKVRDVRDELIDFIATKKEREYIYEDIQNKEKRAFEIYTLKEAYFKMLGTGLQDFKSVEFIINDCSTICSDKNVNASLHYDIDGYVFAICEKVSQ